MAEIFDKQKKYIGKKLDKYPKGKWIIYISIVVLGGCLTIAGGYQIFTGKPIFSLLSPTTENNVELTPQNDLKNYTLDLCQDINIFMANRMQNEPNLLEYKWDMNKYSIANLDYLHETLSLFVKYFSVKISNCYGEFEKIGFSVNSTLKSEINTPVNKYSITYEIVPSLESLANQL